VDVFVSDVSQLLAWDIYYAFNREIVEVTGRNVYRMLEAAPNSSVLDVSDPLPNATGLYRMGAADTGGAGAAENGSGLLASITLTAKKKGVSWSALHKADVDGNGSVDIGPTLTALGGTHISDNDGDSVFDGAIRGGQIAVDTECAAAAPTPTIAPGVVIVDDGGTSPVVEVSNESPPANGEETNDTGGTEATEPAEETASSGSPGPTGSPLVARLGQNDDPSIDRPGGSGSSLATWLVGALAGSAGLGVILTYFIYRTRRPI
jgi:hypothetical protein